MKGNNMNISLELCVPFHCHVNTPISLDCLVEWSYSRFIALGNSAFVAYILLKCELSIFLAHISVISYSNQFPSCQLNILWPVSILTGIPVSHMTMFPLYASYISFSLVSGLDISLSAFCLVAITSFPSWELVKFFVLGSVTC